VKGPAAKIFTEFGYEPSAAAVAEHYNDLLVDGGFVLDRVDAALKGEIQAMGVSVLVTSTMMPALEQRVNLAAEVLALATELSPHS
jgi:LPPG:FO 2-phospho-L-lactate transferase